jgi:Winged helix DNA-binding domain
VTAGRAAAPRSLTAERCRAQLLSGPPAASVTEVVQHLLAVQAQDPRGARLAVRARSAGLSAADVDHALTTERSVLITTLNRGTLHLIRAEDYWWLQALTTPPLLTASARRLAQEKVPPDDAERAVAAVRSALAADGPLTRAQLRERVDAVGVRTEGQAHVHVLLLASLRGLIVRGPVVAGEHAFVLVSDWLGAPPRLPSRDVMLADLARRYLAGHGPAAERDLARWAGLPLGDVRRGLAAISGQLASRDDGLASLAGRDRAGEIPPPRLLGSFDPLLHGWNSREFVLGGHTGIVTTNGVFRPFALVDGRAVATWTLTRGQVKLAPFAPLAPTDEAALHSDAAAVTRYLGHR